MNKEPKAMKEIHQIRESLYQEEKNLTTAQLIAKIRKEVDEVKNKYGLKFKKSSGYRKAA